MAYDENTRRLHLAIMDNDLPLVKKLIRAGAWVLATDKLGKSALHWAVVFGNRDTTHTILVHIGKGPGVNIVDNNGRTALHYAAMEGRVDIGKMLMNRGAKINGVDKENMTPLHYAAQTINPLMIHTLVRKKANRMVLDKRSRIPYHVAQQWGASNDVLFRLQPDDFEAVCAQIEDNGDGNIKLQPNRPPCSEKVESHLKLWLQSAKAYSSATQLLFEQDRPIEKVKREIIIEADSSRRLLGTMASAGTSLRERGTQTAPPPSIAPTGGGRFNINVNRDAVTSFVSKFYMENGQSFFSSLVQCCKSAGNTLRDHTPSIISSARNWVPSPTQILRAHLAEGTKSPVLLSPVGVHFPSARKSVPSPAAGNSKPRRKATPYPLKLTPSPVKGRAARLNPQDSSSRFNPVLDKKSVSCSSWGCWSFRSFSS